ncbi:MAG: DUF3800 domain-containing protein [Coriobacteriales bacterium]|jgi:hypothetical protein
MTFMDAFGKQPTPIKLYLDESGTLGYSGEVFTMAIILVNDLPKLETSMAKHRVTQNESKASQMRTPQKLALARTLIEENDIKVLLADLDPRAAMASERKLDKDMLYDSMAGQALSFYLQRGDLIPGMSYRLSMDIRGSLRESYEDLVRESVGNLLIHRENPLVSDIDVRFIDSKFSAGVQAADLFSNVYRTALSQKDSPCQGFLRKYAEQGVVCGGFTFGLPELADQMEQVARDVRAYAEASRNMPEEAAIALFSRHGVLAPMGDADAQAAPSGDPDAVEAGVDAGVGRPSRAGRRRATDAGDAADAPSPQDADASAQEGAEAGAPAQPQADEGDAEEPETRSRSRHRGHRGGRGRRKAGSADEATADAADAGDQGMAAPVADDGGDEAPAARAEQDGDEAGQDVRPAQEPQAEPASGEGAPKRRTRTRATRSTRARGRKAATAEAPEGAAADGAPVDAGEPAPSPTSVGAPEGGDGGADPASAEGDAARPAKRAVHRRPGDHGRPVADDREDQAADGAAKARTRTRSASTRTRSTRTRSAKAGAPAAAAGTVAGSQTGEAGASSPTDAPTPAAGGPGVAPAGAGEPRRAPATEAAAPAAGSPAPAGSPEPREATGPAESAAAGAATETEKPARRTTTRARRTRTRSASKSPKTTGGDAPSETPVAGRDGATQARAASGDPSAASAPRALPTPGDGAASAAARTLPAPAEPSHE